MSKSSKCRMRKKDQAKELTVQLMTVHNLKDPFRQGLRKIIVGHAKDKHMTNIIYTCSLLALYIKLIKKNLQTVSYFTT